MLDAVEKAWAEANSGANIWQDPSVKFLDPFTKSGVFLREITRRLTDGLGSTYPDLQDRVNHITKNQVFGIAVTRLTSLLARRSVYCSKNATGKHSISRVFKNPEGNIWFEPLEHTWEGGSTKVITADKSGNSVEKFTDGKCKYCRASQKEYDRGEKLDSYAYSFIHQDNPVSFIEEVFGANVKFDVIIGNPPYQLEDGGASSSAAPIYNLFVEQALKLEPTFLTMVIPSRWFSGGKGLDAFRESMLSDPSLRSIDDYPDPTDVFPGVNVEGGVCFFLWEKGSLGDCRVSTHRKGMPTSTISRPLLEPGAKVFIRYNEAIPIVRKVWPDGLDFSKSFSSLVSARKPFGFDTLVSGSEIQKEGDLKLYRNGGVSFVPRDQVPSGADLIDKWKVFISYAYGIGGKFPSFVIGKPFVGEPGTVSSETYIAVGPFKSKRQAENASILMATRFFRFLVLLHKSTQHGTRQTYSFVPLLDLSVEWNDDRLAEHFGLTQDELKFIESMVRPMELDDD